MTATFRRPLAPAVRLIGGLACLAWLAEPATAEPFRTVSGHLVQRPDVEGLDCAALKSKLAEIDATGYRGASPVPKQRQDRPLLDYETEVSIRYYSTCAELGAGPSVSSSNVFRGGFRVRRRGD